MEDYQNRRQFLKDIGLGIAALALPGCVNPSEKKLSGKGTLPNIIFIMTDDNRK